MKKFIIVLTILFFIFCGTATATTFYLDYVNGNDANDGSSWAQAWKTFTLGATLARIAPGDTIRIAKSPAPVSIGNATWTSKSLTVTLASAQNQTIDLCETAWTGAGDCTVTRTAGVQKEGSYYMKLAIDSSPQTNILQAYFATGTLDLSAYQKISFWIRNTGEIVANNWIVNLCSDTAGATVVDSFLIPAIPSVNYWMPLTLTKVGGGNLGNSIRSIAIYSGSSTTGMASKDIYIDNFIACTTNGLNLQSLISKNSAEKGGTEPWFGIQSINGITVKLDDYTNQIAGTGRGYYTLGTTPELVTTYKRETIKTDMASVVATQANAILDSGTLGNLIEFQGGYNTADSLQDGETFFDGLNGLGYGIYMSIRAYIKISNISVCRYSVGYYCAGVLAGSIIENMFICNHTYGISIIGTGAFLTVQNSIINNCITAGLTITGTNAISGHCISNVTIYNINSCGFSISSGSNSRFYNIAAYNCGSGHGWNCSSGYNQFISGGIFKDCLYYGINIEALATIIGNHIFNNIITSGNGTAGLFIGSPCYLNRITTSEGVGIVNGLRTDMAMDMRYYVTNHNGNNYIGTIYGAISSVATDREGGTGLMWKMEITSNLRQLPSPLKLSIAKIAVVADKLVTVKAWMKKDHATNIGAMLACSGGQLTGMTVADITDIKADDADTWEELEITFTPTQVGVVEIEAWAYYVAANGNVYVEDMTITQAD